MKRLSTPSQALACIGIERFIEAEHTLEFAEPGMIDRLRRLVVEFRDEVLGTGVDHSRGHVVKA